MTSDQQAHRVQVCQDLLDHSENGKEFLSKVITGDESRVYGYDVETKIQSSQWTSKTSPRPKKARQVRSKIKVLLTVFFMLVELSTTSTFLKAPQWTRSTTLKFWNVWGGKGRKCGGVVTGFSIMTTLQPIQPSELVSFWPNIPSLFFPTPLTHLTLLHVISFCSPCSKDLCKEEDLRPFQRLGQMRRRSSRALKKKRT